MSATLLEVKNLSIAAGEHSIASKVSFSVQEGEIVGLVGESGSGKTLTSLAVAKLLPRGVECTADTLRLGDLDLRGELSKAEAATLGTELGMVFQDPMSSLNPAMKIGEQMIEVLRFHLKKPRREALQLAESALSQVDIRNPKTVLTQFPHELSGGMRQRVMIAMSVMTDVKLLVADEPTTALDVTVQAQVMTVMKEMNRRLGTSILLISHNIALLSEICDRILVMYRGELVDSLETGALKTSATHPYTKLLIGAIPDFQTDRTQDLVSAEMFAQEEVDSDA